MKSVSPQRVESRVAMMYEYLDYRIAKDPAKFLLNSAFGRDWTERGLAEVMFPPDLEHPRGQPGSTD